MEVKRELLEQAYAMLSSNKTHIRVVMSRDETCVAIRAALAAPATAPEPTTAVAVNRLCKALREDLEYAWSWHCNIAMTAFDAGCPNDVANEGAARFMQLLAGVDTRNHPGFQVTQDFYLPSTAPATAPESGVMTEIDYNDDDALRFVQRVLESDAPLSDIRDARNMVVEIRTRVLKARASKPATAPEPICTKCGDVITAHDPGLCGCCLSTRDATSQEQKDRPINCGTGHCSCIECVMLFNAEAKGPRSGAAVQVTTLNDFSTKFSETKNVAEVEESKDRKTWMHAGDYLGGGY